ncbi:hypothetical protein GCM10007111_35550 [Virgibacillus kapii]|uniref:Glyoxalase/fosfomycin resistance/dioxygenase domain-containing protein n=1 Tax=Virgibacillus kapii TaxID=1638645 RepID=A0ABQ2DSU3_9BACI|nr:hypothetical protein M948_17665 [Virgibacillus sp. CM-4]GGJ70863.1 hypothetical protein GCM10007111_35550 [Virgibacillus kapii]
MNNRLLRAGTTYLPIKELELSITWYVHYLGAVLTYQDKN